MSISEYMRNIIRTQTVNEKHKQQGQSAEYYEKLCKKFPGDYLIRVAVL